MTSNTPNPKQRAVIESTEGIHVVDAGPGTGKTFTVTRRYANLIDEAGVEPDDVLLVTFTDNAATEMKERVVTQCEYSMAALRDAPINTFHGVCNTIVQRYGVDAPQLVGIDDRITSATQILDNEVLERERFEAFLAQFSESHPQHREYLGLLDDRTALLDLIKELGAKGVFPTQDGWYRESDRYLDGDFEAFERKFAAANEPNEGVRGPTQSDLRASLSGFHRDRTYPPDTPTTEALRGSPPSIDAEWARRVFDEDRSALQAFVHDVYFEYVRFALARNYLNYSFLQLFAFAVLCDDHTVREDVAFEYVMVDEFQDTSEIQFKLAVLLANTENLCVVGDWKQSIYGFQYASVENIRSFADRLNRYKTELNADHDRVTYPVEDVERHALERNYRATQSLIDFSEHALTTPATQSETVDLEEPITHLRSQAEDDDSVIEAYTSDAECEAILDRIQTMVDEEAYAVTEDGDRRPPTYDDIAVLTRTRDFGREFQARADEFDIPVAYEGGVELYGTDHAKLLMAWLRILTDTTPRRGWAVVLEQAGYTLPEVETILEDEAYPEAMVSFRDTLGERATVGALAHQVFDRYGYDDAYADALVDELQTTFEDTTYTFGDILRFLERSHDTDATVEVTDSPGGDAVTVQTIHAAKGLEHPIVVLANINEYRFPSHGGSAPPIRYEDPIGLRQTKYVDDPHGHPHTYDNWRYRVMTACLDQEYDEERRLLYVAITRAQHHVVFTAGPNPSPFFEQLPVEATHIDPDVQPGGGRATEQSRLQVTIPTPSIPAGQSPHSLMDDAVFEHVEEGRGREFGEALHDFAEAYADGDPVTPDNDDEHTVKTFLDGLSGTFRTEEHAYLPLTVDGRKVSISGIIDLLHITDDRVDIIDYKTDQGRHAHDEYRKQLSVYYRVVTDQFPNHSVRAAVFYTDDNEVLEVTPYSLAEIEEFVDVESATNRPEPDADDDRV